MIEIISIEPTWDEYRKLFPGDANMAYLKIGEEAPGPFCELAKMVSLLKEAQEKHSPVMIENEDKTRALVLKDANMLHCRITLDGRPILEL